MALVQNGGSNRSLAHWMRAHIWPTLAGLRAISVALPSGPVNEVPAPGWLGDGGASQAILGAAAGAAGGSVGGGKASGGRVLCWKGEPWGSMAKLERLSGRKTGV